MSWKRTLSPEEIAISLQAALNEVENGQTKPISQLWNDLEPEFPSKDELLQFFQPGKTYEIWSPMTTHEAAWQLARLLEQTEENPNVL